MNRLIAATTVAGIIFLAGCGTGDGAEQSDSNNESATRAETSSTTAGPPPTANDQTTTTGPEGLGLKDRPPDSTLSYKDQRVTGTLGSYCWGSGCADVAAPMWRASRSHRRETASPSPLARPSSSTSAVRGRTRWMPQPIPSTRRAKHSQVQTASNFLCPVANRKM